jgi:DNA-binding beta-propeller fold protein YncE
LVGGSATALVLVVAVLAWYLITGKPISQLPGINVAVAPTYQFSINGLSRPQGVAVDSQDDRIYVTQSSGDRAVKVFDLQGNALSTLATPQDGRDHNPLYVAVDPVTRDIFVSDRGANAIYQYNVGGAYQGEVKVDGIDHMGTLAIAIDSKQNIYVADAASTPQRIVEFRADGTKVATFGETANLSFPNGLVVQGDGSLVVADSGNSRVIVFEPNGTVRGALERGSMDAALGMPRGLAVNAKGTLYVVDTVNQVVRVFANDPSGLPTFSTSFGDVGELDGQFNYPNGIATDAQGRVYVVDRENGRLQVWQEK